MPRRGAHRGRLAFPFAGLAAELYGAGMGRGLGDQDFAAVLEVVEGLSGSRAVTTWRVCTLCPKIGASFEKPANLQGYFVILELVHSM